MAADHEQADQHAQAVPLQLEQELATLMRLLEAVQRRRIYVLERAHYLILSLLQRDGPLSVGETAKRLLLDDSTATRQIAAMEALRLVGKQSHPEDARSTVVRATEEGISKTEEMRAARLERVETLFDGWSKEERATCGHVLEHLNRSLFESLSRKSGEKPD